MRVLITGAHGFLGKHVVGLLSKRQDMTLLTPTRSELDLMHRSSIENYLHKYWPNVVIHLAAQCGGIGINREKPGEFLYNNMTMTTNLIDEVRLYDKGCKFVGIGTVCSYPKNTPVPFKEDDLYNGYPEETNAPYGLAKRMQLEMLRAYRTQYDLDGIFLIPVNMVGEYDNFDDDSSHVIPAMMKKFHRAKINGDASVTLWGDGSASREFLYAGDCAEAILRATLLYDKPDPVNIGTGKEITIKELAEKMREIVGFTGTIVWDMSKPNGQPRRQLDCSRAKKEFGFEATSDFDTVLRNTYTWAQKNNVL
jgi:GDP-L-fucose synthase